MTREDFINNVTDWASLIEFCCNHDCDYCEDIYNEYDRDYAVDCSIVDWARDVDSWRDLLRRLEEIPDGYEYYRTDGYGGWEPLGEFDFIDYHRDVLEWGDTNEIWEDEEEEPVENEEEIEAPFIENEEEDDLVIADEPISVNELMGICSCQLQQISDDKKLSTKENDEAFKVFVTDCVTITEDE